MDGLNVNIEKTVIACLAEQIANFDTSLINDTGVAVAKVGILDTLGVTLAGVPEDCTQIILKTPGIGDGPGPATVIGTGKATSMLDATFINGTASHALDFDDFSHVLGGHQSVPLVTPLLALAEDRGLLGRDVINAYIIGLEVEHRFARAVHPHHYDKGWHPTATLGIFGTVAAAAHVMRLSIEQIEMALAIAASFASGLKANFGTMTKPLHVGHSARSGLLAALLAENGFDASSQALEHHQGFFNVFNGPGTFDPTPLTEAWTSPLEIELPDLGLKQFPCCGSTHHAITAMMNLRDDTAIDPADVAKIEIMTHARRFRHTDTPYPKSELQAKFSVQYTVVRALLDGSVRLRDFADGAYDTPEVEALLQKTTATTFTENEAGLNGVWDAVVTVTMNDGTSHTRQIENMVGRSARNPMDEDELRAKFMDCAERTIDAERAATAFDLLLNLDAQDSVKDLMHAIA